jgi:hypothetical protein
MLNCHFCGEEIRLPSNNVRFKEPGKDTYVFFHNEQRQQCWRLFMLKRVREARVPETVKVQVISPNECT